MRRRLWLVLRRLVDKLAPTYRAPERCPTCKWTVTHHSPDCPALLGTLTCAEWKERAHRLYRERNEANERTRESWKRAHLWEGKYHTLRRENNALRKAARAARTPGEAE